MEERTRKPNLCLLVKSQSSSDLIFASVDCFILEHTFRWTLRLFSWFSSNLTNHILCLLCWTLFIFLSLFVGEIETQSPDSLSWLSKLLPMWFHQTKCFKYHNYTQKFASLAWTCPLHSITLCPNANSTFLLGWLIGTKFTTSRTKSLIFTFPSLLWQQVTVQFLQKPQRKSWIHHCLKFNIQSSIKSTLHFKIYPSGTTPYPLYC